MRKSKTLESIKLPFKNKVNAFLWFFQRATAVIIIIWISMHTFTNSLIIQGKYAYEHEVTLYHEIVPNIEIVYAVLGVIIAWHAIYGITNIIRDLSAKKMLEKAVEQRESGMLAKEISSRRNILFWFKSGKALPTRPIWSIHRISALIIIFTVLTHFVWIHLIGDFEYYSNWESVIETFKNPVWMVFYLLFDFGISFHGTQGIRILLTDFTNLGSNPKNQKFITIVALILGIIGFLILAYIDITAFLFVQNL